MVTSPLILPAEERPGAISVVGVDISILASPDATGGLGISLQCGGPGMGPPPHSHPWPEAFFVLRGTVDFTCDGATTTCGPGALVCVPPHAVHAFSFGAGGCEMFEVTGAGSRSEGLFRDLSDKLDPGPPDIAKVVRIFTDNGARVHL